VSLTILTGLPGSGKSTYLVEVVNQARARDEHVATFECSESPWLQADQYVCDHRIIGCRMPGLVCPLDHFVSTTEAAAILRETAPSTLVAFEEAHYFQADLVSAWLEASGRGVDVLVGMPSNRQLQLLDGHEYEEMRFTLNCDRCASREATSFIILPDDVTTTALCETCDAELTWVARKEILDRLERQAPYPGEKVLYQPVELEECSDWRVLRPDSEKRVELMTQVLRRIGLGSSSWRNLTYLDVGCNTGFFCSQLRGLGFYAEGVDVVQADIEVAKILGAFFRRQKIAYLISDCYEHLRETRADVFDVTSAFSVFQWLMMQRTVQHGLDCMDWLFEKTGRVCFLEMGYSEEPHYKGKLGIEIDRAWVKSQMEKDGNFADILIFEAAENRLMRDLFVGLKEPAGDRRGTQRGRATTVR
jgi:SAM-dependent methyltransferase